MERTQKIIVLLLIIAILFSIFSIIIAINTSNISIPKGKVSAQVVNGEGNGGVKLVVENNPSGVVR